ncbi:MAG: aldolase [Roseiarcus sp.]|jgi:HPr kinase/phosphorylase|uniref:HPr kinase/phosphorylase n=1 Tax=Roseiarcus sp. TaxID=1969460 RepID=UPI003BAFF133
MHATAVIYGDYGVLILGPSGSGKSALALALLARARSAGLFAALIGDDRVWIRRAGGRLIALGAQDLAGVIERRMAGLLTVAAERAAVVRLIVELSEPGRGWPRLPDDPDLLTLDGIDAPRLALDSHQSTNDQAIAVDERLVLMAADKGRRKVISLEHCAAVHKNGKVASPPGLD